MHISTQHVAFKQEVMMSNPYSASFTETKSIFGYNNGFSTVLKQIKIRAKDVLGIQQARCPDGEEHHPSVCLRGWRGDVCVGCPFSEV
jgi:hypothetical protein